MIAAGGAILLAYWSVAYLAVDRCLDTGGSFDYAHRLCDYGASHPYSPGLVDGLVPVLVGAGLSALGLILWFSRGAGIK